MRKDLRSVRKRIERAERKDEKPVMKKVNKQ